MDDLLAEVGDLLFTLLIGYMGALEFLYIARHLYHWACRHPPSDAADTSSLEPLQADLRRRLADAKAKEAALESSGIHLMQDDVRYKDGVRVDHDQDTIDELREKHRAVGDKDARREQLAAELERQRQIEQETREELAAAEAALQEQLAEKERAENERRMLELERQREEENAERERKVLEEQQRNEAERKENERKMLELDRQREEEQRKEEEREESERRALELEREREEDRRRELEREENERKFFELERQREEEQRKEEERVETERRKEELEEKEQRMLELEREREEEDRRQKEREENKRRLLELEREREEDRRREEEEEENARRMLEMERQREDEQRRKEEELLGPDQQREEEVPGSAEDERERRQKLIEENARKFMEAEEEMVQELERQQQNASAPPPATVKTQLGQGSSEGYSVRTKPLLFPSVSDEGSSLEPLSSEQSLSYSTQPSVDLTRAEPEGEGDVDADAEEITVTSKFSEEYLRSLDGIKQRPLVREDGSGRRRAFKKRRSSGSSTSSRDSRTSREEELRMFTSLEEEELRGRGEGGSEEFGTPIKYTVNEATLRPKASHRRHKRSPAKDSIRMGAEEKGRGVSLEMLGEESADPWGEQKPELYKNTEFWKRKKAMSIDEEGNAGLSNAATLEKDLTTPHGDPNTDGDMAREHNMEIEEARTNLKTSQMTEDDAAAPTAPPPLRRSPRMDEIDHYEDRWKHPDSEVPSTPEISISAPVVVVEPSPASTNVQDFGSWRDESGLLVEGLSDFYDFTASVNRSRSRSTSRQPSPAPAPKEVAYELGEASGTSIEIYDDTGSVDFNELRGTNVLDFIAGLGQKLPEDAEVPGVNEVPLKMDELTQLDHVHEQPLVMQIQQVADEQPSSSLKNPPSFCVQVLLQEELSESQYQLDTEQEETHLLTQSEFGRSPSRSRSRSRSLSPLPTNDNIERSLMSRRTKRMRQNDALFERLMQSEHHQEQEQSSEMLKVEEFATHGNEEIMVMKVLEETSLRREESSVQTLEICEQHEVHEYRSTESHNELQQSSSPEVLRFEENQKHTSEFTKETQAEATAVEESEVQQLLEEGFGTGTIRVAESVLRVEETVEQKVEIKSSFSAVTQTEVVVQVTQADELEQQSEYQEKDNMRLLVECLRAERSSSHTRSHSRSRSRSPLPTADNLQRSLESRRHKLIQHNEDVRDRLNLNVPMPTITIEQPLNEENAYTADTETSPEAMMQLVQSLRIQQVRSRSTTPQRMESPSSDSTPELTGSVQETLIRSKSRSSSPKLSVVPKNVSQRRSLSPANIMSGLSDNYDFHSLLNKGSQSGNAGEVQLLREEMVASGFKRSTYVGESEDLGSEYEALREEASRFRRSTTPSPSPTPCKVGEELVEAAQLRAAETRALQARILAELAGEPSTPETPETPSEGRTFSMEVRNTEMLREEQLAAELPRSTYVGESLDLSETQERFRRSRSKSRSPLDEEEARVVHEIEVEAVKRELQDELLDELENFEDLSRHLQGTFESSKSDMFDESIDPDEYHHFRRFSIDQKQPAEDDPQEEDLDADYVFVSEMSLGDDFYDQAAEEEESDDSEDERRTVVEVEDESDGNALDVEEQIEEEEAERDDEIDEDICDFEVRGPADESYHEQSECEEAEREQDLYAGRSARDWETDRTEYDFLDLDFGRDFERDLDEDSAEATDDDEEEEDGESDDDDEDIDDDDEDEDEDEEDENPGVPDGGDSDSVAIDRMYDDAIRNRKQSGILRDFDSLLEDIQETLDEGSSSGTESRTDEASLQQIDQEYGQLDNRYLGNAPRALHQATRLRSRYRFEPVLPSGAVDVDIDFDVDLNYTPRREYNWRKNFRLDDEAAPVEVNTGTQDTGKSSEEEIPVSQSQELFVKEENGIDDVKEEIMTETLLEVPAEEDTPTNDQPGLNFDSHIAEELEASLQETPEQRTLTECPIDSDLQALEAMTKKKNRKKVRKEHRSEDEVQQEPPQRTELETDREPLLEDNSFQAHPGEEPPKPQSRSRRSSKGSVLDESELEKRTSTKKRSKKSKPNEAEPEESSGTSVDATVMAASSKVSAEPEESNKSSELSEITTKTTPAEAIPLPTISSTITTTTTTTTTPTTPTTPTSVAFLGDSFDILKDANFYPLF